MARAYRSRLSEDEREAIREMKERFPRMTQREIAARFNVSGPCVHQILTYWKKPGQPKIVMCGPPPRSPLINWTPDIKRLTAGR